MIPLDLILKYFDVSNRNVIEREDDKVNIYGTVVYLKKPCKQLPFQFGFFEGNLNIDNKGLTTLIGSPEHVVNGYFSCDRNKLSNLVGAPRKIDGSFYIDNPLTTLEGLPECSSIYLTLSPKLPLLNLFKISCSHRQ